MLVLVVGLGSESGKTVVASSLVTALRSEGFRAEPFKPAGATDLWVKPWILGESSRRGILVTWDGLVLSRAGSIGVDLVNPIAAHVGPLEPRLSGQAALAARTAIVRVTRCRGGRRLHYHYVNPYYLSRAPRMIASRVEETARSLRPEPSAATPQVIESMLGDPSAADECLAEVESASDVVVVESNSDVAVPTPSAMRAPIVVVAYQGGAAIVRGDRFFAAVKLRSSVSPPWSVTAREALELAGAHKAVDLPLLDDPLEGIPGEYLRPVIDEVKEALAA